MTSRETIRCVAGPMHSREISVPPQLDWFAWVEDDALFAHHKLPDGIIDWDTLTSVLALKHSLAGSRPTSDDSYVGYVRTSFVSGEHGLVQAFKFQAEWSGPAVAGEETL